MPGWLMTHPYVDAPVGGGNDTIPNQGVPIVIDTSSVNQNEDPFAPTPGIVEEQIEYDPETNTYSIFETIGDQYFSNPKTLTFDEYLDYQLEESKSKFWEDKSSNFSIVEGDGLIPSLYVGGELFDRLFGGSTVDIRPAGNINLIFGGNWQRVENPILPQNLQRQGNFDFDMDINMNTIGQIGDKMKLNFNYNTLATFDFENEVKLQYTGDEDQIIQKVEAGNVSLPLNTLLIPGSQSLFGLKTELKFGRLNVTGIVSQQKSESRSLTIEGGSQTQQFEIEANQYEENRHFLLGHYFRDTYNSSLAQLPFINSAVNINRIEVWITNDQGATEEVRDVVAFMDLGETDPFSQAINPNTNLPYPTNNSNDLYPKLYANENTRQLDEVSNELNSAEFDLLEGQDFIITRARKLKQSEYTLNPQLGFISLNLSLQPDQVIAVSYQYTRNDDIENDVYQVGEFGQDIPIDPTEPNVIFLKMLKSTTQSPVLPIWDLMMKNIYSLGAYQVEQQDFRLDLYYQDPGGGVVRILPSEDPNIKGIPLIQLMNLDNLNSFNDPQPDGIFDFVPGTTINPQNGRLIFPVLEPFSTDLAKRFSNQNEAAEYTYPEIYDSTKIVALQFPENNRFIIRGNYKSRISSDISLGAFNLPPGSVIVTQGGQQLVENRDYTINYSLGKIQIINDALLQSGVPINVQYENPELFGFQLKSLFGSRLDYWINDNFTIGGTYMHLQERPFTQKVNFGDDPISNSMYGADINYFTEAPFITKFIDKIPFIDTKETSSISFRGEVARFQPGHSKAITDEGQVFIDDFEGSTNNYDMKFPFTAWALSSAPKGSKDQFNQVLFPEAGLTDSLDYGFRRAKLGWYQVDPIFCRGGSNAPDVSDAECSNHYVREVLETEVFPNAQNQIGQPNILTTFNLAYYPEERGPYNYGIDNLNTDGTLKNPKDNWAGVMRSIDYNDFEAANIEFIDFWMLDPFIDDVASEGGSLYFNLGEISEDVLKDSKNFFENGLPQPGANVDIDTSNWSLVPLTQAVVNTFDNNAETRTAQDVGFDGMNDDTERELFAEYLNQLNGVVDPDVLAEINADPSNDNYRHYRDESFEGTGTPVLDRYKFFNNPHGNSPIQTGNANFTNAATNIPDSEDLNRDNTLNRNESFFEYRVDLRPNLDVGESYVTDIQTATVNLADGTQETVRWYHFQIPIQDYSNRVGAISDFRSIRFMRMFMTNFDEPVVCRFANIDLVRNQWRRYLFSLQEPGEIIPNDNDDDAFFNVTSVSFEQNAARQPIPYVIPPGVQQEQIVGALVNNAFQNEQSMAVQVCGLQDGDARALFKNIELDMRDFGRLSMFLHAEEGLESLSPVEDGDVTAFVRIGSDFRTNFYEYEIPLEMTAFGTVDPELIWPVANRLDFRLDSLTTVKRNRNINNLPANIMYSEQTDQGHTISVLGTPDLGQVKSIMLGVRNPKADGTDSGDDGEEKCVEVWFNELSLTDFNKMAGNAALATADIKLADWGNMVLSGNMHTAGFGNLEQQIGQRFRDNYIQYDGALNLELGRFFGEESGIKIPMRADYSQSSSTPQYDPYETDIVFKDKLQQEELVNGKEVADSIKDISQDVTTIKSINFTNVRKVKTNTEKKNQVWDIENWNATYAYTERDSHDPIIEREREETHFGSLGYNYSRQPNYITPFKNIIKSKSKWLKLIKDFNFNPLPNTLTFRTDIDRRLEETKLRKLTQDAFEVQPTFNKDFNWNRFYGFKYDIGKTLTVDFNAQNSSRIDEPPGKLNSEEKTDSVWNNIRNLGRTTSYGQTASVRYRAPLDKLPLTDWIDVKGQYGTNYNWDVGPFPTVDTIRLGNTISNGQNIQLNAEFKMRTLYNKWKFLKFYDSNRSKNRRSSSGRVNTSGPNSEKDRKKQKEADRKAKEAQKLKEEKAREAAKKKNEERFEEKLEWKEKYALEEIDKKTWKEKRKSLKKIPLDPPKELGILVKPLTMLKRVSANYTEDRTTVVPGFNYSPQYVGQNFNQSAPGLDFIFGYQPNLGWLDEIADKGWITEDTTLNFQVIQNRRQNLTGKASLEPFNDFRIDLNATYTYSKNHTEFFKKVTSDGDFQHLTPIDIGSYTISYLPINTAFRDTLGVLQLFEQFQDNREIIADRLNQQNENTALPYINPLDSTVNTNYVRGYGPYSQDVLIPAFISAYKGEDPNKVNLNFFKQIPLPNWRINYNGLTKLGNIKRTITNLTIKHGYNSTFTVNQFTSNLNFEGDILERDFANPTFLDTLSGNYYALYEIPAVVVSETFAPLIGVDMNFVNGVTTRFDFKKSRNLAMSFLDYQLSETRSEEFTIGIGYRIKGVQLPFKIQGKKINLENDLNFAFDMSYRDNFTVNYRLDQDGQSITQGAKTIRISPRIDYVVNNQLNVSLFYDYNSSEPKNSASYNTSNTKAGIRVTFNLAN